MPKTIVILTSGTRGDVLPYLALGQALQKYGLTVRIAAHKQFAGLVQNAGLEFALLTANPSDLLTQPGEMPLTLSPGWLRGLSASLNFWHKARPLYSDLLVSAWQACQGADGLIVSLPTTWGQAAADALGIPSAWCLLQPITPTRSFPSPFQPNNSSLKGEYNRITHRLVRNLLWLPWRKEINHWRVGLLGIKPLPAFGPYQDLEKRQIPMIYGFSEQVVPRPVDWPEYCRITGFWHFEQALSWRPSKELHRFLQAGRPPIYVGFGSMGYTADLAVALIRAAERVQERPDPIRVIAALKKSDFENQVLPANLLTIEEAPHDWLFAHLQGAIHHGGAGTTAASLRAGLPTAITPVGIDQFFWGDRVHQLGVGPRPVAQKHLTEDRMVELLTVLSDNSAMRSKAQELGIKLRMEDGPAFAADFLANEVFKVG